MLARADLISRLPMPNRQYWYIAQSYGRVVEEYDWYLRQPWLKPLIRSKGKQPYPHYNLRNGVQFGLRSFERPDNLVGSGLNGIYFDEAALADRTCFTKVVRPLVADKRGFILFTSTFRGLNWFWEHYQRGQNPAHHAHTVSWLYPTTSGYAFRSPAGQAELELMRQEMPVSEWEEECLCIPAAKQCAAFRRSDIDACIRALPPRAELRGVLAWDTGKASDPGAVVVLDPGGVVRHAETYPIGLSYDEQLRRVCVLAAQHGAQVVLDSTGAGTKDAILDFAKLKLPGARGLQWKGRHQEQLCQQLELDLQNRKLWLPSQAVELIRELRNYERHCEEGRVWYCAPHGDHDDLVAALAMANYVRAHGWTTLLNANSIAGRLL